MIGKQFSKIQCASLALLSLTIIATGSARAQTYSVIHTFAYMPDGSNPNALIQDAQGNLYGTTRVGGTIFCHENMFTCGSVFKVDPAGNLTVLYTFRGGADGSGPITSLIRDAAGNLYGDTQGDGNFGDSSTVFKVEPSGKETVLYDFNGFTGCCQDSPLALDPSGNLYGTSPYAGDFACGYQNVGCGSIYRLTPTRQFRVIHTFTGTDGNQPEGGVLVNGDDLYGSTILGGDLTCYAPVGPDTKPQGCGTLFRLDGKGKLTQLHVFIGKADGSAPLGVIQDAQGNLYGIAEFGGDPTCYAPVGCGTIFKVDTSGKFSVLFTFTSAVIPEPSYATHLLIDAEGNLYGVTQTGGANFSGFLFKLALDGTFTNLFSFPGTENIADGSDPQGVVMDSAGNFFGSMLIEGQEDNGCGNFGCGTLFEIAF
jgi:uncharacterized repeat protein (TIGR03803 family)